MHRNATKCNALTLAILASCSYPAISIASTYSSGIPLVINSEQDATIVTVIGGSVQVVAGGNWVGTHTEIGGSGPHLLTIVSGGKTELTHAKLTHTWDDIIHDWHRTDGGAQTVLALGSLRNDAPFSECVLHDAKISLHTMAKTNPQMKKPETAAVAAQSRASITLDGGSVSTTGTVGTSALLAKDGGAIIADRVTIKTAGELGYAVRAVSSFQDNRRATVALRNSTVKTEGPESAVGIQAHNPFARISVENTEVTTAGRASPAIEALNGASVSVSKSIIITNGNEAHGVSVGDSSRPASGFITISDSEITTEGVGSAAMNLSSGSFVRATKVKAIAKGEDAHAAQVSGSFVATDSTLESSQGAGIFLTDNACVELVGTKIHSALASLVSNLDSAGQSQRIMVGDGSVLTDNNGILLQVSRTKLGMDGKVVLQLGGGSVTAGAIYDLDIVYDAGIRIGDGGTELILADGASWTGELYGLSSVSAGNRATLLNEGSAFIIGSLKGGENSTLTFQEGASISGNVTGGKGSTATFNGKTSIGGFVDVVGSTVVFAGPASVDGSLMADNSQVSFSEIGGDEIGGDVVLSNGSMFRGATTTEPLQVSGNVSVFTGSTLGGNLKVAGSLNAKGGIVSPGNSIGTQRFDSIVDLGSQYIAEVNAAGESDLIIAENGDVTLSGTALTVSQENGNGGYRLDHDYTILVAEKGNITGDFASAGLDSSFDDTLVTLQPVVVGTQDVKVRLSVDTAKVEVAKQSLSSDQGDMLDAIVSVAGINSVADALVSSAVSRESLNQVSGEIHPSTQSALLYSSSQIRDALSVRMQSGKATQEATPLWAKVQGGEFSLKGNSNSAKAKTGTFGLTIGGDTAIAAGWRLGAAFAYTDGKTKVHDRASSRADVNSYTGALYGGKSWENQRGQLDFLAGAAFTHHDIKTRRHVTVGGNQTLKADYRGKAAQAFTELGYGFNAAPKTQVGPYAGVAWTHLKSNSFDEKGGDAALRSGSRKDSILTTTLGVRGQSTFDVKGAEATLHASLGWRHASGDVDPSRSLSFITGGGTSFSVAGAPIAKDAAVLNLGIGVAVTKSTTLGMSYNGQFGSRLSDNNGSLFMKVAF